MTNQDKTESAVVNTQMDALKREVLITHASGVTSSGEVNLQEWSSKQQFSKALKILALSWGAAIVSILIPVAHFFLVPLFFILGPVAAYFVSNNRGLILGGKGTCPKCSAELPIAKSPLRWPLDDVCTKCQSGLTINLK